MRSSKYIQILVLISYQVWYVSADCKLPATIESQMIEFICPTWIKSCKSGATIQTGVTVGVKCREHYEIAGNRKSGFNLECNGESWTGENRLNKMHCKIKCGQPTVINRSYITNGIVTERLRYPWHVTIFRDKNYICGGSLINPSGNKLVILTAAHCLVTPDGHPIAPHHFQIVLGAISSNFNVNMAAEGTQIFSVKEIIIHENYDTARHTDDIALIYTDKPIQVNRYSLPICLPNHEIRGNRDSPAIFAKGRVIGFGSTNGTFVTVSPKLREVSVTILSTEGCVQRIEEDDIGSPPISSQGIVSSSPPGTECTGITMFTRVYSFMSWIYSESGRSEESEPRHENETKILPPSSLSRLENEPEAVDAKVIVYDLLNFTGEKFVVTGLKKIGDCARFWKPSGGVDSTWQRFNDRTDSIELGPGVCVRLYEHDCDWVAKGHTLDASPSSPWLSSLKNVGFANIVSGVKLIECPSDEPALVTLWSQNNFKGESFPMTHLRTIGDCQPLWSPVGVLDIISQDARRFNDKIRSVQLADNVCVRLYEHDCDWVVKGHTLDANTNSPWLSSLDKMGFANIVSGVKLVECPSNGPALVTLWSQINFKGDSFPMTHLRNVGDCQELWNPTGLQTIISQDARRYNDRAQSVQLENGICVRLFNAECDSHNRILDTKPNSPWAKDLAVSGAHFKHIVSAVKIIECPKPSGVTLFKLINFQGDKLELHGLNKVGDCVNLWSPNRYQTAISDEYRMFNDLTRSIKLEHGICVRLYAGNCGAGKTLEETCSNSTWAKDLHTKQFYGILSSIELIRTK